MRFSRIIICLCLIVPVICYGVWRLAPRATQQTSLLSATPELETFVHARPNVPVVFTSRSDTSSFQAAAPEGEEFDYPGLIPWAPLTTPATRVS